MIRQGYCPYCFETTSQKIVKSLKETTTTCRKCDKIISREHKIHESLTRKEVKIFTAVSPKKPRKKSSGRTIKIDPLDALASEYVRKKSKGFCERCGKYYGWQNLQCCHFHGRRRLSVRYDIDNMAAMDFGCHTQLDSQPMDKVEWFRQHLGQEGFDMLNSRMRITYPRPDRQAITLYLQAKIKELGC